MRDPGEIVDLLYSHCFGESGTVLDMLTEQFSSMKMGNNESPNMYAARLDLLIKQIEQAGGTTSDTEAASRFRGGLPNTQAWATFTSQCDSYRAINDRSMSYAEIRRAAQLYYPSARKLQSQNAQAFALMLRPHNNKRNHYQRRNNNQPRPQGNNQAPRPPNNNHGQRFRPPNNSHRPFHNNNHNQNRQQKRQPPSPCMHCNGNHWHNECPRLNNNNGKHKLFAVSATCLSSSLTAETAATTS